MKNLFRLLLMTSLVGAVLPVNAQEQDDPVDQLNM